MSSKRTLRVGAGSDAFSGDAVGSSSTSADGGGSSRSKRRQPQTHGARMQRATHQEHAVEAERRCRDQRDRPRFAAARRLELHLEPIDGFLTFFLERSSCGL